MVRSIVCGSVALLAAVAGFLATGGEQREAEPVASRVLLSAGAKPLGTLRGRLDVVDVGGTKAVEFDGATDRLVLAELVPGRTDAEKAGLPKRAFTVGGWVNVRRTTRWGAFVGALQDNGPAERGWMLGFEEDRFSFGLSTEGANDGDGWMTYLRSKNRFETGRWCHVVATYDGKTMRLFVDGKLEGESTEQSGDVLYPSRATFVVGGYLDADEDHPFSGWIESLNLTPRARSEKQVAAEFAEHAKRVEYRHPVDAASSNLPTVVKPFLQFPTKTSIHVVWETDGRATSTVEYGPTSALGKSAVADGTARIHDVLVDGLEPRTNYFYRVRSEDSNGRVAVSEIATFQTAVEDDDAYAFTVVGDTQYNPRVTGKIAALCYGLRPNFHVHAGDLVSTGDVKRQWVEHFFGPSHVLTSRVAMYPVLGNHERNAHWFYDYFSLPEPEYRYTFRYGNAQFFMLDTNKPVGAGTPQYEWLDAELAASKAEWKFAVHHHPIWSSDSNDYGDTSKGSSTWGNPAHRPLAGLYEKHGVDVVFNGHVHVYERTWPMTGPKVDQENGVRYVTTGGSGGGLEQFAPNRTWFQAQGARVHHFCFVAVHGGTLRFRAFDEEGRMFDLFEIVKD